MPSPSIAPQLPITHLLYLHGFRSSPQSTKARLMAERVAREHPSVTWWCPQLPPSPREAAELIDRGTAAWPRDSMAVVGSSLGGFYATWLAETRNCKAVMLNPAVFAARDLARYVGEHTSWHDPAERFVFKAAYVDELRALERQGLAQPDHYFAIIARGDEVLSWREMTARYAGAAVHLLEGSDHAISEFEDYLPEVLAFLNLV
jgi:predicted esterase YcpF (UPF0227 family)